jgi:hypothetical protein
MASSSASGPVCVSFAHFSSVFVRKREGRAEEELLVSGVARDDLLTPYPGQIDREGNPRKVVNCSCVVVKDWGEESQERSILLNYFQQGE